MSDYLYSVDDNSEELMHYGVVGMKWHHHRAAVYAGRYNAAKARGSTAAAQRYMNKYSQHLNKNVDNASPSKYNSVSEKDIKRARTISNIAKGVGAAAVAAGGVAGYRAYSKAIKRTPSERAARAQAKIQAREIRERMNYARGAGARIQRNANRVQKPPSMRQQQKAFRKAAGMDFRNAQNVANASQARDIRRNMSYARGVGKKIQKQANRVPKMPSLKQQQRAFRNGAGIDIQARANGMEPNRRKKRRLI